MATLETWLPDTNTILRYLLQDEPDLAARASTFWDEVRLGRKQAVLTEGVLMECVYVLQRFYKVPRAILSEQLAHFLSYKGLKDASALNFFQAALKRYRVTSLDFVDCLLLEKSLDQGLRLFSFDEKLVKLSTKN